MVNHKLKTISLEMLLYRGKKGMVIFAPEELNEKFSLGEFVQPLKNSSILPCNVYALDVDSKVIFVNEIGADDMGFSSINAALGKSVLYDICRDTYCPNKVKKIRENNWQTIQKQNVCIFDEESVQKEYSSHYLTIKSPLMNSNNQIIGVFGCSINVSSQPLAQSLDHIVNIGLLHQSEKNLAELESGKINDVNLTPREIDVLKHLIRGRTAKEIGARLFLSPRTIEQRIGIIKDKFGLSSRSALIELVIDRIIGI